jgi:predicted transcriptional regulator
MRRVRFWPFFWIGCLKKAMGDRFVVKNSLANLDRSWLVQGMTAQAVIDQFKALPLKQRAEVAKFIVASDDSWIPESFKRGMADAKAGRFADMDAVLSDAPPPSRRRAK